MKIEGEKYLDRKLRDRVKKLGGEYIKMETNLYAGLPDRLVLLPKGVMFFAEIKTSKQDLRKLQKLIANKFEALGVKVYKVDSSESIDKIMVKYE